MNKKRPIFKMFPKLNLPFTELCDLPTPVKKIETLANNAWIKCDDISHPIYGGNKLRKLEFISAEMQKKNIKKVYTFGATGTNAGVAAALICQQLNIDLTIFMFYQPPSKTVEKNQALMKNFGAKLSYIGPLWLTALIWYLHPQRLNRRNYFLFAGCSNPISTLAYINAVFELHDQFSQENNLDNFPKKIFVACSSATTLAGLTLGCHLAKLKTEVVGIRVSPKKVLGFDACTVDVVKKRMREAQDILKINNEELPTVILSDEFYYDGYGITNETVDIAISIASEHNISLEQTYSGRAFVAFLKELNQSKDNILFWNTYNSLPSLGLVTRATTEPQ